MFCIGHSPSNRIEVSKEEETLDFNDNIWDGEYDDDEEEGSLILFRQVFSSN